MSRRSDYIREDVYEERDREYSRRPRNGRSRNELDIDIDIRDRGARSVGPGGRAETVVLDRRDERRERERVPEFLRDDYGSRAATQQLVIREERDETSSRGPGRRRSMESIARSRGPERVEKEQIIIRERERERDRRPERVVDEEIIIRDRDRERERRPERVVEEEFIIRDRDRERERERRPERVVDEEIIIRDRDRERERRPERVVDEEIIIRDRERERRPERIEKEEIIIRERDRERDRRPERVEQEEIIIREDSGRKQYRDRLPYPSSEIGRSERVVEREEVITRDRPRSRAPSIAPSRDGREEIDIRIRKNDDERSYVSPRSEVREEIDIRETTRSPPGRDRGREDIDIRIRESDRSDIGRARSSNRGNVVARKEEEWLVRRPRREPSPPPRDYEREEIIIRRKERSPSPEPPPPVREVEKEEIIIRRKERSISPEPVREIKEEEIIIRRKERSPSPDLPPPLEPIMRPPIVQEVITHYRNYDHGFERVREPSPSPPPPPVREKEEDLEIAIHRSGTRNGKAYDEELVIERDRKEDDRPARRQPSAAPSRRRYEEEDIRIESNYHDRRAPSRGYPGGISGSGQEITWQRYNGERMSKFAGDRIYEQDRTSLIPAPPIGRGERVEETRIEKRTTIEDRSRPKDRMWTEVTKDLVIKEAIEETGYDYEETDQFYYVMEYLRYEDVLRLVELTEDIRRERRERIREIQWEREELERAPKLLGPPPPPSLPAASVYDERIYERDVHYERDGGRRHRY